MNASTDKQNLICRRQIISPDRFSLSGLSYIFYLNWSKLVPIDLNILAPAVWTVTFERFAVRALLFRIVNDNLQISNANLCAVISIEFNYVFYAFQKFRMAKRNGAQNVVIAICAIHANNLWFFFHNDSSLSIAEHLNLFPKQAKLKCVFHFIFPLLEILIDIVFYRKFRLCITNASGYAHTPCRAVPWCRRCLKQNLSLRREQAPALRCNPIITQIGRENNISAEIGL